MEDIIYLNHCFIERQLSLEIYSKCCGYWKRNFKKKNRFSSWNVEEFVKAIETIENEKNSDEEINSFFEENRLIALNIVKKENLIMNNIKEEAKDFMETFFPFREIKL